MSEADPTLARLKRLPVRLRLAHLAALLRHERQVNKRECPLSSPSPRDAGGEGSNPGRGRQGGR